MAARVWLQPGGISWLKLPAWAGSDRISKGQSLEYFITIYSLGSAGSRPKWKDSGKAKLEKLLQVIFPTHPHLEHYVVYDSIQMQSCKELYEDIDISVFQLFNAS